MGVVGGLHFLVSNKWVIGEEGTTCEVKEMKTDNTYFDDICALMFIEKFCDKS